MIVLVNLMSSLVMVVSTLGCVLMSSRMYMTSVVGTLEYILAISSDANFVLWLMGMLSSSFHGVADGNAFHSFYKV